MRLVVLCCSGEYHYVVQKDNGRFSFHGRQQYVHRPLECFWSAFQSRYYPSELIKPMMTSEGRLSKVLFINFNLPLSRVGIKSRKEGRLSKWINTVSHSWELVTVRYGHSSQSPIIHAKSQIAVYFGGKYCSSYLFPCIGLNDFLVQQTIDFRSFQLPFCWSCLIWCTVNRLHTFTC